MGRPMSKHPANALSGKASKKVTGALCEDDLDESRESRLMKGISGVRGTRHATVRQLPEGPDLTAIVVKRGSVEAAHRSAKAR